MISTWKALCATLALALVAQPNAVVARDTHAARDAHAAAAIPANAADADAAWADLLAGNRRFRAGKPRAHTMSTARFATLAKGQHPKAIVLTCSDSRVPPELVFDQGVGDVFVVRLAGNVAAKAALGSVEYAAEHLGAPLLVVLGHTRCGAVSAAASAASVDGESNIGCILADIAPAVALARKAAAADEVDVAVHENAKLVAAAIVEHSEVVRHLVQEKKLEIVTAVYDLATGAVHVEPGAVAADGGHAHASVHHH